MRTPSGELHVVDFKTEQIVASIQPADYWDDKRHWEIKNNIDTLEFRVFDNTRHSSTLMQQNLVLKEVRDGRIVPYVITEIEKNSDDRSVIAYASGEWIQLAKAGIIPPQKLEGKTVIEMVDIALAGTKWQKGNLEYASFRSMTIDEFIDPLTLLKKIASLFELEIQYRAEVVGSQVVGRYVDMVKKRGRETGKEVTLGKDLMGIKRIENSQNICTALLGFVKKEGGEFVTIAEINNGVPYLVDNDAFQRWNEKGQHKFGFYSPETENEDMDSKRLMTLMNTELKKRVNTSVFYEVEAQSIGRVFGLAHELINEGDTIRIKDIGFTPKLYLEARTIAGDESFKNPLQDKYVFGDYHEIIDPNEELRKIYNRILSSLGNKQEMIDQLDKLVKEANETASNAKKESEAAKALAEKVQENIKNNTVEIIESKNPPTTGLKPYKTLWRDISNGKPGVLKIWTGEAWESVVPDVESVKKETLEQVNKDIETTKTELNQKVQEAQNQATGQFNEVKENLQGVSRTISNVENKQGEIDKKVTQFEQDSSGFKTSIESLTKKDTEISNKLNTVESTVDGTKKTITDVQSKVDNMKMDMQNLIVDSEFKLMTDWIKGSQIKVETGIKSYNVINASIKGEGFVDFTQYIEVESNTEYTFSCNAGGSFKIFLWEKKADKTPTAVYKDNQATYSGKPWDMSSSRSDFTRTIKTQPDTKLIQFIFRVEDISADKTGTGGRLGLPKLSKGNVDTGWSPSPKDTTSVADFKKVTTEITEQAGKISEKLTSVETKVANTKIGGRNTVLGTSIPASVVGNNAANQTVNIYSFAGGDSSAILNKEICVSFDWKIEGTTAPTGTMYMQGSNPYPLIASRITFSSQNLSGKYLGVITISGSAFKDVNMRLDNFTTGAKIIISNFQIEIGNTATEWTPAPEDQVTTDEFTKKTTEIEKSVEGVKTTVTNVQNSQDGFEKRMSNVEQTATGLSSTVSNLNNVVSDQGKKLTEANTKLEQQATAIGAKVELKQVEDYVAGFKIPELKQTVNQNKQDLLNELANKLATEQFNQKMTLIDNRFTINEQGINAAAKKTEVYTRLQADGQFATDSYVRDMESRLQITEKGVSISVKENDVIAAFNMSKENIKLNAARIDLVGKVNAEWIKAGMLSGCQIRTSNTDNYVSLDDQFIRLYEKGVARSFLGHYRRTDGSVQPTFILGTDEKTSAPAGALFMSQAGAGWSGAYASIGISDGIVDGTVQKSVYWELQRNGLSVLNANDYHVFYAGNGSWYFRRGKPGLYQTSLVVEDNSTDSDLRLPNITLRNSRAAGYTGIIQVKSPVTQNGWGSVQGNFMSPSLREYKSNIRDVSFSALEKIRNVRVRQFNYKNAVNELYKMREERDPNEPPLTTEDIKTYYGAIVDECDESFIDESGKGIHLYSYSSLTIKALQELEVKHDEEIKALEERHTTNMEQMNRRIEVLEQLLVQKLINEKLEQQL
ncbi:phage tail spike protein [Bacillus cereus group sp. RP32]|uniref:phage tail spike protein n=1 Tax=Bacillus cereus group sp. RP32 TaxID=3040258 RepID=UPI00339AFB77